MVFAEIRNFWKLCKFKCWLYKLFNCFNIFYNFFNYKIYFIRLEISIENLLLSYCLIITFFTILFLVHICTNFHWFRVSKKITGFIWILFNNIFIFFNYARRSFYWFSNKKSYALITIPFLGYLYGTSLSQGVAGSTAASIGIILFLNLAIYDYLRELTILNSKLFLIFLQYYLVLSVFNGNIWL